MSNPYRTSPLENVIATLKPVSTEVNEMRVPLVIGDEAGVHNKLGVADLSFLQRFGLKGPMAAEWLLSRGITPPAAINAWDELAGGGIIARLGSSEFFVEDAFNGEMVAELRDALGRGAPGVAPVFRQDVALAVTGSEVNFLLVQTGSWRKAFNANMGFLAPSGTKSKVEREERRCPF